MAQFHTLLAQFIFTSNTLHITSPFSATEHYLNRRLKVHNITKEEVFSFKEKLKRNKAEVIDF